MCGDKITVNEHHHHIDSQCILRTIERKKFVWKPSTSYYENDEETNELSKIARVSFMSKWIDKGFYSRTIWKSIRHCLCFISSLSTIINHFFKTSIKTASGKSHSRHGHIQTLTKVDKMWEPIRREREKKRTIRTYKRFERKINQRERAQWTWGTKKNAITLNLNNANSWFGDFSWLQFWIRPTIYWSFYLF